MKPHKHHDCIVAWANGAEIQFYDSLYGYWSDVNEPVWSEDVEYRIKPDAFTQKMIDFYKSGYKIKYRLNTKYASKWYDLDFVNPKDIETYNFDQLTYKWSIDPEEYTGSPYRQYIEAEKAGKQIQYKIKNVKGADVWVDKRVGMNFDSKYEYRVMPKIKQIQYDDPTDDIDEILDCFDFERVKKVMDHLNWEWVLSDSGVPEIYELRKRARELLQTVVVGVQKKESEGSYFTATGGFYAEARVYPDDSKIYLRLSFQVTDWDNWES